MNRFLFQVNDKVYWTWADDFFIVSQKRIENGHLCYRLDDGSIVNENQLR